MKTTKAIGDKRNVITVQVSQVRDVRKPVVSGSGRHADRRLARLRTRGQQDRRAMSEW